MRFNMLCFARLRDPQGRHALLINKGKLLNGEGPILTPVGGSLRYRAAGRMALTAMGATDFEGDARDPIVHDLCFRVDDGQIGKVVEWFGRRVDRETSVRRELAEELGDEAKILTPGDLRNYSEVHVKSRSLKGRTTRDVPDKRTIYLIEVFDVRLNDRAMGFLRAAAKKNITLRKLWIVTPAEIDAGRTHDGVRIGRISKSLLRI
jgi:hypothetical protein